MKKIMFIIMLLVIFTSCNVYAEVTEADTADSRWYIHAIADDLALGASSTAYTTSEVLTNSDYHSLAVRASSASAGTVSFTVQAEYSINKNSGFAQVSDPITFDTIDSLGMTPVKLNRLAFMPFIRFKFTSDATQANDVKIDAFFIRDTKER